MAKLGIVEKQLNCNKNVRNEEKERNNDEFEYMYVKNERIIILLKYMYIIKSWPHSTDTEHNTIQE